MNIITNKNKKNILNNIYPSKAFTQKIKKNIQSELLDILGDELDHPDNLEQLLQSKTIPYHEYYQSLGISPVLEKEISQDLEYLSNIQGFIDQLNQEIADPQKVYNILKALFVAQKAHNKQISMRPGDVDGTDFIPYLNHPVQLARLSLDTKLSDAAIKAALLHDVWEDTDYKGVDYSKHFDAQTLNYLDLLTQKKGEKKSEYFARIDQSDEKEVKLLKALDRYHNLIRSFPIKDPDYLQRYSHETQKYVAQYFLDYPELEPLKNKFFSYLFALKNHANTLLNSTTIKSAA